MSLQDTKRTNKKKGDQTKNSRRRSNEEKTLFAEILADKDNKFLLVRLEVSRNRNEKE